MLIRSIPTFTTNFIFYIFQKSDSWHNAYRKNPDKNVLLCKIRIRTMSDRIVRPKNMSYDSTECFISTWRSWHFRGKSWHTCSWYRRLESKTDVRFEFSSSGLPIKCTLLMKKFFLKSLLREGGYKGADFL